MPAPSPAPGTVPALQGALTAEDAAIYGYGLAGPWLSGRQLSAARQDWEAHRSARGTLTSMITRLGASPAPAPAAYRPPFPVDSASAAVWLAAALEDGVVTAYLGLVAVSDRSLRQFGATSAQTAAIRAAYWHGRTTAFPGLPDSALRG